MVWKEGVQRLSRSNRAYKSISYEGSIMPRTTMEDLKDRENFVKVVAECVTNPSKFSEIFLDHKLFEYNQKYVNCQDRFIVYR